MFQFLLPVAGAAEGLPGSGAAAAPADLGAHAGGDRPQPAGPAGAFHGLLEAFAVVSAPEWPQSTSPWHAALPELLPEPLPVDDGPAPFAGDRPDAPEPPEASAGETFVVAPTPAPELLVPAPVEMTIALDPAVPAPGTTDEPATSAAAAEAPQPPDGAPDSAPDSTPLASIPADPIGAPPAVANAPTPSVASAPPRPATMPVAAAPAAAAPQPSLLPREVPAPALPLRSVASEPPDASSPDPSIAARGVVIAVPAREPRAAAATPTRPAAPPDAPNPQQAAIAIARSRAAVELSPPARGAQVGPRDAEASARGRAPLPAAADPVAQPHGSAAPRAMPYASRPAPAPNFITQTVVVPPSAPAAAAEPPGLIRPQGAPPPIGLPIVAAPAMTPGAVTLAGLVAPPPADALPEPHTVDRIVQTMRLVWARGVGEAQLRLEPGRFGDLTVSVRVEHGLVVARLQSDVPAVREWLQANQQAFRHGLAEHHLDLHRLEITAPRASADESGARDQNRRDSQDAPFPRRPRRPHPDETFDIVA